jgi:ABC-type glycerol-3-phosphate transport system permease component
VCRSSVASAIDGASRLQALYKVDYPFAAPGPAATAIFTVLG